MEFSCGSTAVSVRGSVIVPVKANAMEAATTLKFASGKGRQKPEDFAEGPKDVLEASFDNGAFEQLGVTASLTQTSEERVEVNPVF